MSTPKPKLYIETTIPSYLVARPSKDPVTLGHQQITSRWWESLASYEAFVSGLVLNEAGEGDPDASRRRLAAVERIPVLPVTGEAIKISEHYLEELLMPPTADADALHLALATFHRMDYLLTWNCRHLARGSVLRRLPEINGRLGYTTPTICTPEELLYDDANEMD